MSRSLAEDGFAIISGVLDRAQIQDLVVFVEADLVRDTGRGGVRNLLAVPEMRRLAESAPVRSLVEPVLGDGCFPVRGILFDKTADANWKVPWHQDVTIAARERVDAAGYGPWSLKDGVVHVQPPVEVLERMLSVRIHLDPCPTENGALKVIAGSHRQGKLPETDVAALAGKSVHIPCEVDTGGALLMFPLLLHASSASTVPGHRRVLHFDFAAGELPGGPVWAERR